MARKSYAPLPRFTLEQLKAIKAEEDWYGRNGRKSAVLCWPLSKMRREAKAAGLPENFDALDVLNLFIENGSKFHNAAYTHDDQRDEVLRLICLMLPKFWAHRWIKYVRSVAVNPTESHLPERGLELYQKTFTFGTGDKWWSPSYDGRYFLGDLRDILTRAYGKRTYPKARARSKVTA